MCSCEQNLLEVISREWACGSDPIVSAIFVALVCVTMLQESKRTKLDMWIETMNIRYSKRDADIL